MVLNAYYDVQFSALTRFPSRTGCDTALQEIVDVSDGISPAAYPTLGQTDSINLVRVTVAAADS